MENPREPAAAAATTTTTATGTEMRADPQTTVVPLNFMDK